MKRDTLIRFIRIPHFHHDSCLHCGVKWDGLKEEIVSTPATWRVELRINDNSSYVLNLCAKHKDVFRRQAGPR
jgi:hypothetical protein